MVAPEEVLELMEVPGEVLERTGNPDVIIFVEEYANPNRATTEISSLKALPHIAPFKAFLGVSFAPAGEWIQNESVGNDKFPPPLELRRSHSKKLFENHSGTRERAREEMPIDIQF